MNSWKSRANEMVVFHLVQKCSSAQRWTTQNGGKDGALGDTVG